MCPDRHRCRQHRYFRRGVLSRQRRFPGRKDKHVIGVSLTGAGVGHELESICSWCPSDGICDFDSLKIASEWNGWLSVCVESGQHSSGLVLTKDSVGEIHLVWMLSLCEGVGHAPVEPSSLETFFDEPVGKTVDLTSLLELKLDLIRSHSLHTSSEVYSEATWLIIAFRRDDGGVWRVVNILCQK